MHISTPTPRSLCHHVPIKATDRDAIGEN